MVQEGAQRQYSQAGGSGNPNVLQISLEQILREYRNARAREVFAGHALRTVFANLEAALISSNAVGRRQKLRTDWSIGQGNWAKVPWIAFLDGRETTSTQRGVYCCFLFRQDMSGVYLTYNQGVTELRKSEGQRKAREILRSRAAELRLQCQELQRLGFSLDDRIDLRADPGLGADYEHSTIAYKLYRVGEVPPDSQILQDVEAVLGVYDDYLAKKSPSSKKVSEGASGHQSEDSAKDVLLPTPPKDVFKAVLDYIEASGFTFEPWQVAAYVTALRTKPFVILAGVSGTGKSKLPKLVAEATGGKSHLIPVRPDWTDSSEVLGYADLQGSFRPGSLLRLARTATENPKTQYVCIIDEMNLARVEHYFAEVLSCIEDRTVSASGGFCTGALLNLNLGEVDGGWAGQILPSNLAIVGTVNMDETTHGFSRKVLDRAFTLEFSDVDLTAKTSNSFAKSGAQPPWPVEQWYPRAIQLNSLPDLSAAEQRDIDNAITVLTELNSLLLQAQLQVAYRTRNEVALFVLHARALAPYFRTKEGGAVDPLDLAIHMKVLPRIVGGSNAVRRLLLQALGWARNGKLLQDADDANSILDAWNDQGRPSALSESRYPRTAARLCLMWDRLLGEGFTSYWL